MAPGDEPNAPAGIKLVDKVNHSVICFRLIKKGTVPFSAVPIRKTDEHNEYNKGRG